jgi:hypothetical protein
MSSQYEIGGFDWKRVSLTREGEGGGNFPDLESCLQYIEKIVAGGYMPSTTDPFEIVLGPGDHSYTRTTAFDLPAGIVLRGSGPGATRIVGTPESVGTSSVTGLFGGVAITVPGASSILTNGDRVKISEASGSGWTTLNSGAWTINFVFGDAFIIYTADGVVLDTSGFADQSSTDLIVERLVPIFKCEEAIFSDLTFSNCGTAIQRNGGSALVRLDNVFGNGVDTIFDGTFDTPPSVGINIIQNCTSTGGTNTQYINDGGVIFAMLDCFFNLPSTDGTVPLVNHRGSRFAMRDCIFDGILTTDQWALDINFADNAGQNPCQLSSNDYYNIDKAIRIQDNDGIVLSSNETISNCNTDLEVLGAGGTYSGVYSFSAFTADPSKFELNGNTPPYNVINSTDGSQTAAAQTRTITTATTLDQTYSNVLCSSTSDFTVTLPDAAQFDQWVYTIKNINTNLVTIATTGGATIDNEVTEIVGQYEAIKVVSDGTNWWVI